MTNPRMMTPRPKTAEVTMRQIMSMFAEGGRLLRGVSPDGVKADEFVVRHRKQRMLVANRISDLEAMLDCHCL